MTQPVTVIPGDGIGPEVTQAVLTILQEAGADLEYDEQLAGVAALEPFKNPLPEVTLESIRRNGIALKGRSGSEKAAPWGRGSTHCWLDPKPQ